MEKLVSEATGIQYVRIGGEDILQKDGERFKEYRRKWVENAKNFIVDDFPLFLDIEVASGCNLNCPFCRTIKKGKIMPFEYLKKIIDEAAGKAYGCKFSIRGEPLLNPELPRFIKYAKKSGMIDVYFNTNATLLTKEMSKALIDAGLDRITISFDGYTKAIYEKYRVGATFEKTVENVRALLALKGRPKVRIQTIKLPVIDMDKYKIFWSEVDEIGYLKYQERVNPPLNQEYWWACAQLWQRVGILAEGIIVPCCQAWGGDLTLGHIATHTIKEIWRGKRINEIRKIHRRGLSHTLVECNKCGVRGTENRKEK